MLRKTFRVDGRRSNDHLEIRTLSQNLLQITKQKINVQAAFVRLVDDQRVILAEPRIALRFSEQDAVGHQLDVGLRRRAVGKADLVADHAAQFAIELLRHPRRRRPRRDAPWLRVADQPGRAAPEFKAYLGNLRRLARAGFAADDHHLIFFDQRGNLGAPGIDRQIVGKLRPRQSLTTQGDRGTRFFEQFVKISLQRIALGAKQMAQIARHRTQTALIGNEAILEFGFTFQWRESGGKSRENNRNGILPVCRSGHDVRPSSSF